MTITISSPIPIIAPRTLRERDPHENNRLSENIFYQFNDREKAFYFISRPFNYIGL